MYFPRSHRGVTEGHYPFRCTVSVWTDPTGYVGPGTLESEGNLESCFDYKTKQ